MISPVAGGCYHTHEWVFSMIEATIDNPKKAAREYVGTTIEVII